jgi:hypothetical protein
MLEQIYGSSNSQRSSSSVPENISSSSINIDQGQEEQSRTQEGKGRVYQSGKPDCPISQTRVSGFGRIEIALVEEKDCSTSSSNDDDDDTDDEYDHEELLTDFQKLISNHMKLQETWRSPMFS